MNLGKEPGLGLCYVVFELPVVWLCFQNRHSEHILLVDEPYGRNHMKHGPESRDRFYLSEHQNAVTCVGSDDLDKAPVNVARAHCAV